MSNKAYSGRLLKINTLASDIKAACVESQFDGGKFIDNQNERAENMVAAANNSNLFESIPEQSRKGVVTAIGSAIRSYQNTYGEMPSDELLASGAQAMINASPENMKGSGNMMMESIGNTMTDSEGITINARQIALILPTMLQAATSDMVTYIPATAEKAEIFEIQRTAVSSFGDFNAGDRIDNFKVGQYGNMLQGFACADGKKPNGTLKQFVFDTSTDSKLKTPIKRGTAVVYLNSKPVAKCNGQGVLVATSAEVAVSGSVNLSNGIITADFVVAPASGAALAFEYEVDIEKNHQLVPKINLEISSVTIVPHDSVIGNDHTIQSYYTAKREYGIDLGSQLMAGSRNVLANEKDTLNILKGLFAAYHKPPVPFHLTLEANHTWRDQYSRLLETLDKLSTEMLGETTTSGIKGIYCGNTAINVIKTMAGDMFEYAPNYVEKPTIHYVGRFGRYRIYHVPTGLSYMGCEFTPEDMLCYGRGENHSEAGIVNGDAVSPVMLKQGSVGFADSNIIWTRRYQDVHPNSGFKYFRLVRIVPAS